MCAITSRRFGRVWVREGEQVKLVEMQVVQICVLPRQVAQDSLEGTVQLGGSYRVPAMCPHLLLKAAVEMEHPICHPQLTNTRREFVRTLERWRCN